MAKVIVDDDGNYQMVLHENEEFAESQVPLWPEEVRTLALSASTALMATPYSALDHHDQTIIETLAGQLRDYLPQQEHVHEYELDEYDEPVQRSLTDLINAGIAASYRGDERHLITLLPCVGGERSYAWVLVAADEEMHLVGATAFAQSVEVTGQFLANLCKTYLAGPKALNEFLELERVVVDGCKATINGVEREKPLDCLIANYVREGAERIVNGNLSLEELYRPLQATQMDAAARNRLQATLATYPTKSGLTEARLLDCANALGKVEARMRSGLKKFVAEMALLGPAMNFKAEVGKHLTGWDEDGYTFEPAQLVEQVTPMFAKLFATAAEHVRKIASEFTGQPSRVAAANPTLVSDIAFRYVKGVEEAIEDDTPTMLSNEVYRDLDDIFDRAWRELNRDSCVRNGYAALIVGGRYHGTKASLRTTEEIEAGAQLAPFMFNNE